LDLGKGQKKMPQRLKSGKRKNDSTATGQVLSPSLRALKALTTHSNEKEGMEGPRPSEAGNQRESVFFVSGSGVIPLGGGRRELIIFLIGPGTGRKKGGRGKNSLARGGEKPYDARKYQGRFLWELARVSPPPRNKKG